MIALGHSRQPRREHGSKFFDFDGFVNSCPAISGSSDPVVRSKPMNAYIRNGRVLQANRALFLVLILNKSNEFRPSSSPALRAVAV